MIFSSATMFVQIASMAVLTIGLARYLPVEEFGEYTFIIALTAGVMAITHFGLQPIMVREISVDKGNAGRILGNALVVRVIMLVVGSILLVLAGYLLGFSGMVATALLLAVSSEFLSGISALCRSFFQAIEKMEVETLIAAVYYGSLLLLLSAAYYLKMGFLAVFGAVLGANLIQLLFNYYMISKHARISFDGGIVSMFFLSESFLLGLGILMRLNIPKVGIFMVKFINGATDVAFYQAAQGILLLMETLSASMIIAIFPTLSRMARNDTGEFIRAYEKLFKIFMIISFGIFITLLFFSKEIIMLLYGQRYASSVQVLRVMSVMVVFLYLNIILSNMFVVMKKQRYVVISAFPAIGVSIVLSAILTGRYGIIGTGIATTLAYMTYSIIAMYLLLKMKIGITISSIWSNVRKVVFAGVAASLILALVKIEFNASGLIMIFAGAILYFLLLILFKGISRDDIMMTKGLVLSRRSKLT